MKIRTRLEIEIFDGRVDMSHYIGDKLVVTNYNKYLADGVDKLIIEDVYIPFDIIQNDEDIIFDENK